MATPIGLMSPKEGSTTAFATPLASPLASQLDASSSITPPSSRRPQKALPGSDEHLCLSPLNLSLLRAPERKRRTITPGRENTPQLDFDGEELHPNSKMSRLDHRAPRGSKQRRSPVHTCPAASTHMPLSPLAGLEVQKSRLDLSSSARSKVGQTLIQWPTPFSLDKD